MRSGIFPLVLAAGLLLGRRLRGGDKVEVLEIVGGLRPYEELKEKINALLAAK